MTLTQQILVPLDGSPLAEVALTEAAALSKLPNIEVTLLQVVPPIEEVIQIGLQEITLDQQWQAQRDRAFRYLHEMGARPEWQGVFGSVADKVLRAAMMTVVLVRPAGGPSSG